MAKIKVLRKDITVTSIKDEDYISLTDIARYKNQDRTDDLIRNWLRNRNTLEFLGIWEHLNNPGFNPVEFDGFRMQAGGIPFEEKMAELSSTLYEQMRESIELDEVIRKNLGRLGYGE